MQLTKQPSDKGQKWWIYILGSMNKAFKNYSYIGMTMNVNRRIKEHNKEAYTQARKVLGSFSVISVGFLIRSLPFRPKGLSSCSPDTIPISSDDMSARLKDLSTALGT